MIVEGIPGSGKSTTAHFMKEHLEKEGFKVKLFQEGDTSHPADYESTACLNEGQFNAILERFPDHRESIKESAKKKGDHYFISYRHFLDTAPSVVECLASYDVYELDLDTFEEVSYKNWTSIGLKKSPSIIGKSSLIPTLVMKYTYLNAVSCKIRLPSSSPCIMRNQRGLRTI